MMTLKNKRILIIGGSSGIGLRVAELAAEQGADLLILGRDAKRLDHAQATLAALTGRVEAVKLDATDIRAFSEFVADLPPIDHMVSMLGGAMGGGLLSADLGEISKNIDAKFQANLQVARIISSKLNTNGSMVFTSGSGGRPHTASGAYVGNMALKALTESLAVELAPRIRVNAVAPTWTPTPFWRDLPTAQRLEIEQRFCELIPLKRVATLDELASGYLFLLQNGFITGQELAIDGGIMLTL
ncbi:SDR family oxidoreductase [Rahnella sp. SAP-1]|uniref:SDR family oxidoreductase n=1 Tax=Rouxiella aceris TaxID=2703884 RepID=A0A848MIK6_9GAMM|nr:SDR family oxidoreductase [Rouxiella aceris]NMP27033.1 SDR family oxidoreductase [Rouxiella aceris]